MKHRKMKEDIKQTFLSYAAVILLAILLFYFLSLYLVFYLSIVQPNKQFNEELTESLTAQFQSYRDGTEQLASHDTVVQYLLEDGPANEAYRILYDFRNKQAIHSQFVLLNNEEEMVATSFYQPVMEAFESEMRITDYIKKSEGGLYEQRVTKQFTYADQGLSYLFAAAVVADGERLGTLLFMLDHELPAKNNLIYMVTDRFDNLIFQSQSHVFGIDSLGKLMINTEKSWLHNDGDYYYQVQSTIDEQGIQVITLAFSNSYAILFIYGIVTMIVASMIVMLIIYLVTPKIIQKSLEPFNSLVTLITTKNHNSHFRNKKMYDEVWSIYEEYQSKITEIHALVDQNQAILEKKRLSEISHLEAKFNPHFLYNVLEMIKYETLADPKSAADMIVKTAKLMRYNANFGRTTVLFEDDLAYVQDYFSLQKMRYGKRLQYQLEIEPKLVKARVPKLLLQPLIENAIKHGVDQMPELFILVKASLIDEVIQVEVSDNGMGIEEEKLKEIELIMSCVMAEASHTGLKNTHQMLQLLYGNAYGVELKSEYKKGTTVRLTIPYEG
ncbi:two-component system sensor histidine kinase YesM [Alkalihalobacillus xiaoxiensis]|uniref:Two-component system sensor histidine kinase YesM n=1 Tax=Shouchella xiaoxiensis TaxID=766895 RepID=A0ABS2SWF5_9BACI|nr:histidine kinase [Shouchella xiaoxiensis]MBM7838794.1 two-component system sensor histidine kinase YesM [Shouchella xiaoxiensis]